jgi:hypothetical protein
VINEGGVGRLSLAERVPLDQWLLERGKPDHGGEEEKGEDNSDFAPRGDLLSRSAPLCPVRHTGFAAGSEACRIAIAPAALPAPDPSGGKEPSTVRTLLSGDLEHALEGY